MIADTTKWKAPVIRGFLFLVIRAGSPEVASEASYWAGAASTAVEVASSMDLPLNSHERQKVMQMNPAKRSIR